LILINLNLPSDIRCHIEELLCVGNIPGPKQPKDFDSFTWPLVEEAHKLAIGVQAYDIEEDAMFIEHAYICLEGGDM
ncbi:hypothetical protein M422DRAFT_134359, partial [Sphaerobolus stellatus SS14]